MSFAFRPLTRAFAADSLAWRYDPPYDVYNTYVSAARVDEVITAHFSGESEFRQVELDGVPIAIVSFGADGRVNGGDYHEDALDIGLGVAPHMTGRGLGTGLVREVVGYAVHAFSPPMLRVTIAAFNLRAQRVWVKNGFQAASRFTFTGTGMKFIVYTRSVR
ncbi:MAG: GNAT family N-acetyltransferase [Chloroflexi bacterium]|nr:GNAT family N-acetyltransferase [Chloroflexota bacterium]